MKASHIAIDAMKGHLDAVYDITVAYEGTRDASGQRKPAPSMPGTQLPVFRTCRISINKLETVGF